MRKDSPLLELHDVGVAYNGIPVFRNVDATVAAGECILVTGDNGSGKSTLLRVLAGIQRAPRGTRVARTGSRGVRLMPQAPRLAWSLSAKTNVALALADDTDFRWWGVLLRRRAATSRFESLRAAAERILARFGLAARAEAHARELSGGERKLLAVALALAGDAPVVLLDEPFAGLSSAASEYVRSAIVEAKNAERTVIIVEHRTKHAVGLADRVWHVEHGKLQTHTAVDALPLQPASPNHGPPPRAGARADVALAARGLRGGWHRSIIVDCATFHVARGAVIGVIGENGSGKSTLVALLSGTIVAIAGRTVLANVDVTGMPAHERVRMGLRVLLQTRRVFSRLSIEENFRLGGTKEPVDRLLPIPADRGRLAGTLSGGEQTIVGLNIATGEEGTIAVVLDEPTAGLDRTARARVGERIVALRAAGIGCLVVDHDAPFLDALSDRVLVLEDGRVSDDEVGSE